MKDDVVTVIDAEADQVAVAERLLQHLDAIHEHAVAIAPVFNAVARVIHDNGCAMARDAAVDERDAVVGFAAADEERGLRDGDGLTGLVRGDHFNECMGWRGNFHHGVRCGEILTRGEVKEGGSETSEKWRE